MQHPFVWSRAAVLTFAVDGVKPLSRGLGLGCGGHIKLSTDFPFAIVVRLHITLEHHVVEFVCGCGAVDT